MITEVTFHNLTEYLNIIIGRIFLEFESIIIGRKPESLFVQKCNQWSSLCVSGLLLLKMEKQIDEATLKKINGKRKKKLPLIRENGEN